jgi:hypothetical protein
MEQNPHVIDTWVTYFVKAKLKSSILIKIHAVYIFKIIYMHGTWASQEQFQNHLHVLNQYHKVILL